MPTDSSTGDNTMKKPTTPHAFPLWTSVPLKRRDFLGRSGALLGTAALAGPLAACGGSDGDPIWSVGGAADQIANSLSGVSQSSVAVGDFSVLNYGAQARQVVAATSPYP